MRRTALFVAGWVVAGVASVTAASLGVSLVGNQVTADRPTPLSATEVRNELAAAASTSPTAPSTTVAPAEPSSPDVAAPPDAGGETRTFALVGGTATLRFDPAGATVVAATPAPGFAVETSSEHGNGVRVEFESDEHRSRVTAWWEGGPRQEVREDD